MLWLLRTRCFDSRSTLSGGRDLCPPFVEWSMAPDIRVTLVSDGFGFYIEPLLNAYAIVGRE
jgi:hypothetical protein